MEDKPQMKVVLATGKEESVAALEDLLARAERGELGCMALRVYNADGTWEDVVLGAETEEERAKALADLHESMRRHQN